MQLSLTDLSSNSANNRSSSTRDSQICTDNTESSSVAQQEHKSLQISEIT